LNDDKPVRAHTFPNLPATGMILPGQHVVDRHEPE
jgi:hypothetical protein